jgi:hypothetical protein
MPASSSKFPFESEKLLESVEIVSGEWQKQAVRWQKEVRYAEALGAARCKEAVEGDKLASIPELSGPFHKWRRG